MNRTIRAFKIQLTSIELLLSSHCSGYLETQHWISFHLTFTKTDTMVKRDWEHYHHQSFKAAIVGDHFPASLFHIMCLMWFRQNQNSEISIPCCLIWSFLITVFANNMDISPMCTAQMLSSILPFSPSLFHPKHPCDCSLLQGWVCLV